MWSVGSMIALQYCQLNSSRRSEKESHFGRDGSGARHNWIISICSSRYLKYLKKKPNRKRRRYFGFPH